MKCIIQLSYGLRNNLQLSPKIALTGYSLLWRAVCFLWDKNSFL